MTRVKQITKAVILSLSLALNSYAVNVQECHHPVVKRLIDANLEPDGVVFELVEYDKDAWDWAAPMVESLSRQLKNKYPNIDIAIVSHGNEQFQLTQQSQQENQYSISILNNLNKSGVDISVCGINSSWNNVAHSDYIDIIDVASSGPALVNDYLNLGYRRIKLQKQ